MPFVAASAQRIANPCHECRGGLEPLRGERNGTRSTERLRESGEDHEIGVKPDALDAANAEERKPKVVFEISEFALNGRAAAVHVAPFVGSALNRRSCEPKPVSPIPPRRPPRPPVCRGCPTGSSQGLSD